MASENEASCESDPNFAVICCFLEKFGETCGLSNIDFLDLQEMLENTQEVPQDLVELHIKLLRKAKKSVSNERWERALIKMCHSYCSQDAWELERFGYKKSRISVKLRTLKYLLEMQFDLNQRFKNEVNKMSAEELRTQPLGRDRLGNAYWCQCDEACQIRVYKEDPDEETWTLVARSREGLVSLISQLNSGDSAKSSSEPVSNEDSNSVEVEKPILDTGQSQDSSNSSDMSAKQLSEDNVEANDREDLEMSNQISDENVEEVEECDTREKLRPDEIPEEKDGNESVKVKPKENLDSEQKPDLEDKSDDANETSGEAIEEADEESNDMSEDSKSSDQSAVNNNAPEVTNNALNLSSKNDDSLNLALNYKKNNDTQFEYDSESKTGLDLSFKPKPTLRLKPLQELLVQSKLSSHEPDKREFIGIKGKYIRGDPSGEKISLSFASHSSSSLHRKAVQSATFDAISYKRSIEEDDYEEQPMKRSRFDRPTLLGNKKFVPAYDEGEVEDEIEEPLMLVHGESSGYENECNNVRKEESPVVGEEIEEPTFYVFGEGNGVDCQTGNENLKESDMPQSTNSDKAELNLNLNKDLPGSSGSVLESKRSLMSPSKLQYKLGTIIDTKTDKSIARTPVKKSRWDIVSDGNLKLNDAEAKVSESERVVEVSTGKVKELVDKFENLSESLVNVKTNTLTDNNSTELSNSAVSDIQDQSDKSTVKKSMFFFGNSSNVLMGANIQSASLNFGASSYSNSLKAPSSDTSNISDTENSQEKSFTPVNINKVPEKSNETASKSALQMSNSADLRDSDIENADADDDKTNCDSVLEGGVDKNSEISECDLSSVSSVNTNDTDNNSCKKAEDEPDLAGNDDQANKLNDEVATAITGANLENNTDSKKQTVTEIAVESSSSRVFSNSQANVHENKTDEISSSAVSESETIKGLTESRDSQNPECENEIPKGTSLSEEGNISSDTEANLNENKKLDEVSESVKSSPPDDVLRSNQKLLTAVPVNEADCREILDSNSNDVFKMKSPFDTTNNTGAPHSENIEANSIVVSDTNAPSSEDIETVELNEAEKLDLDANNQSESSANDTTVLSNDIKTIVTMTSCEENTRSSESDQSEACADVDESISQEEASSSSENEIKDSSEEQISITPHLELGKEKNSSTEKDESRSEDDEKISKNEASQESVASLTASEVLQPDVDVHDPQSSVGERNDDNEENTTALTSVKDESDSVTEQIENKGVGNAESTKETLDAPDCKQIQEERNSLETNIEEKTNDIQENLTNKIAIENKSIVESASNVLKEALIETEESLQSESNNVEEGLQSETDLSDESKVKNSSNNCEIPSKSSDNEELHSVLVEAENETQGNSAVDKVDELNQEKKLSGNMKTSSFEKVTVESAVEKDTDNKLSKNSVHYPEVKESQIDLNLNTTLDETETNLSDKETEGKVVCKEGMKNTSEENANCKETLESEEDKDAVENIKDADLKENENQKQVTGNNETDVLNRSSNNLLQKVDPSPKLDVNQEIVPAANPISLQENPTQGQEALPKVGKKRGRKPKHLLLEKREFKEFREKRELRSKLKADQQSVEAEKEKSDAGGSGAALNKKFEVVKGIDDQSKKKAKRGRKPLNLKIKRIAVAIVPKIKAKKLTSPSSQKAAVKKVEAKGQGAKVGRPRKSSTEKSAGDASPEKKNKSKPVVITKVMKKTPKSPINVKLGRRRRKKDLVEKTEEVVKKRGPKKKNVELPKEVEMGSVTKRTELVVKLKRAELTKNVAAELRNNAENSERLNLMVSLERCQVPMTAAQLHNKERMMSLRKRKPKPLGVIKPKKSKELLRKKSEELEIVNTKSEPINIENVKQETNLPGNSLDTFEENKQDLISHNKIDNADNSKCQKSCKSIVGTPRRRSSRRKTITDAEAESNIDNSTREFEISSKQNECEADKHENENLNDVNVRREIKTADCEQSTFSVESNLLNRFKLSNNDADTSGTINIPPKEEMNEDEGEDDSLDVNRAEGETEKITEADDMETIDLTSETEGVASSAAKNLYQEKLTDCKQGVMIKGVLIKGDVTIKVKERIPVEEPLCVKKNVPLLTCIDIEKLKEPDSKCFPGFDVSSPPMSEESFGGGNSDVVIIEDDPLADIAPMESAPAPFTLSSFKLDSTEPLTSVVSTRSLRKRTRCEVPEQNMEENYGKKRKRKGKRLLGLELRKSIEEQKRLEVSSSSSSEEDTPREPKKKEPFFKSKNRKSTSTDSAAYVNLDSPDAITLDSPTTILVDSPTASSDATVKRESPIIIKKRSPPKKRKKTLLGLDIPSASLIALQNDSDCNTVRQSRRIAQLKIREEAERRKLEEMAMSEVRVKKKHKSKKNEDKDYKVEKKKKNKELIIEEDIAVDVPEVEEKKKKRKRKHKDPRKIFDESNPWRSSSDSSTSNEEDEEEEIVEYSEAESPLFKSDHEFSPESDLEESGDVQPPKRARTARKEDDVEEDLDDHACQKCGKQDHPEWILLCDKCDNGWHCSCLRPALLIIPEGDWFCPPCQHLTLINKLEKRLVDYDKQLAKRNIEVRRKQRLAYVGITLANVLPVKEPNKQKRVKKTRDEKEEEDESESEETESETESSSDSESDEPIYQLRQRRQAHSYRFNDYDELIDSAIQDEVEAKGIGNQGRGKDIATIVNAEKEEAAQKQEKEVESLPPVVPTDGKDLAHNLLSENDSDAEKIKPVKKLIGRKKPRKLNCLDVSSGDDPYSDEDFKGSSSAEEEDDFDDELGSESSEGYGRRRGSGAVRRSTRARTSRYDKEFINDDSDDDLPKRKRIKSIWDDSESEESDISWKSRRKRKGGSKRQLPLYKKKSSKKSKKILDSDSDAYKKKKPRIKYGGLDDDEDVGRRTRGKRINYIDALASDSEDEVKKRGPPKIESDEEYDANAEQDLHDDEEDDVEEEDKDSDENENRTAQNQVIPRASSVPNLPDPETTADAKIQDEIATATVVPEPVQKLLPEEGKGMFEDHENEDEESELNPIDEINKNLEQMNEKEMEMLMEEEEYANKQLQLMAMQLEREKKRKEREANKKLEKVDVQEAKAPKKRGRKPKGSELNNATLPMATLQVGPDTQNNSELSEPPGVTIPLFSDSSIATPESALKKRRGRGKGKKTLEKEQAAAAAAAASSSVGCLATTATTTTYSASSSNSDHIPTTIDSIPSSSNSPSSNTSMHAAQLAIASAPQPFSQSQPTPSVITRMLQSQPTQGNFHMAAGMGGHKYYSGEPQAPPSHSDSTSTTVVPPTQGQYMHSGPRVLAPSYRQPLQNMNSYPITRGSPAPAHRLRAPAPQGIPSMYHSHHPLDPSPSGGGPINVPVGPMNMTTAPPGPLSAPTERNSPGVAPPTSDSPLSNKSDQTPPPPPYTRPQMSRFPQGNSSPLMSPSSARHPHLITPQHVQQPRTNMPYHPGMPPNYYSSYMHPNMATEESLPPPSYQYSEQFSEGSSPQDNCKSYEEENSGEFGGLVSYFSSQREDDLDT